MDRIHPTAHFRTQLRSKSLFEVKAHQIPFVYAGLVGAVGIEPRSQLAEVPIRTHSFHFGASGVPAEGAFLGHIHTPELRLGIVWVNLLMIPRDYSSCTSSLPRICGSMNLAMSAQIFVGGLGAVAPETAAFFDKECKSCAVCESCKRLVCKVLG